MITLSLLHPVKEIPVQVWTFTDESLIRIGRSADNQVVLYSAVVSRHHVELRRSGRHWEVINLGTNGTYLEGKRITQVLIQDGAVIRLARSGPNLQIRMGEAALKEMNPISTPAADSSPRKFASMMPTQITKRPEQKNSSESTESNPDEETLQSEQTS
ncbi:FHA domain-containing protein [Phormidium tenue FACHB-886]|nr:FHA domain-containing protein [Phormidium tenue FACHB-886]